jgi:hypothetical protein
LALMLNSSKKISELQTRITELEAQLATAAETHTTELAARDQATEELTTKHSAAILAKETELADLKAQLAAATQKSAATESDFETRVNAEVIRRCAAAGVKAPIVRNPEANGAENLEEIRERIRDCTDPKERFELARKARELRQKAA